MDHGLEDAVSGTLTLALIVSLAVFVLYLVFQDWVTVPRFNEPRSGGISLGKRTAISVGNVVPPLLLLILVAMSPTTGPLPWWTVAWGTIYFVAFLVLAWLSWYQPYVSGTTPERAASYEEEFAGTIQVLPPRGDHPRPNLAHVVLHLLMLLCLVLFISRVTSGQ